MKNKKSAIIVAIILVLIVVLGVVVFLKRPKDEKLTLTPHALSSNEIAYVLDEQGVLKYIDGSFSSVKVEDENSALKAIEDIKDILKIKGDVDDVLYLKDKVETDTVTYYELQQKYNGYDVIGGELTISVDKDGKVLALNGKFDSSISPSTYGLKSEDEIKNIIASEYGENIEYASITKAIYKGVNTVTVYVVDFSSNLGVYEVIINAKTGEVITSETLLENETYEYTGKGLNNKEYTININSTLLGAYEFKDPERNIIIADGRGIGNEDSALLLLTYAVGMTIPMGGYMDNGVLIARGSNPIPSEELTQNAITAMSHYAHIYDYNKRVFNRNSYDNKGGLIKVTVMVSSPFGNKYQNASWMKKFNEMFIGYNGDVSYVNCLDVLSHEFIHGVINHTAEFKQYPSNGEEPNYSGALDEGYADVLGTLIEGKDWIMGDALGEGNIIRNLMDPNSLENPSEVDGQYFYPTGYLNGRTMEEFFAANNWDDIYDYDNGGVHKNSNVVSHAAYLMYEKGAFSSKEEMAKVWYDSLLMLSPHANFEDCAYAVLRAAANRGISGDNIAKIRDVFYETKMLEDTFYNLSGTVYDEKQKGIEGVSVVAVHAMNPYINYEVYTDKDGNYSFENLPEGKYTLVFDKAKYVPAETTSELWKDRESENITLEKIDEENAEKSQIVFVMDISGSMDTSDPTDVRKRIIVNVLSSLSREHDVALVTFAKNAAVINDGLSNKAVNKKILMTDIFNISNDSGYTDNSGTNGKAGIKKAISLFDSDTKSRKYIVFLTDGMDNVADDTTYDELIEKAKKKNIRILSIGLGEDLDESNLQKMVNETKGKYYFADSSTDLYQFDYKIFAELE